MLKNFYSTVFMLIALLLSFLPVSVFADDHGNSCSRATSVNIGSTVNGRIETGGDYDYFKIMVPSSGTLTVYTTGSTDTYGYLNNSSCNVITRNDDSGSGYNFRISRNVSSGTYYVKVKHYNSGRTGSYTLHVEGPSSVSPPAASDDHGNSISSATSININQSRSGNIERGGDYDYFRIRLSNPGTLKVFTTGSTDTYGYLKNSSGSTITSNDDSGSRNFKISRQLSSGTYYVAVRHYHSSSGTGRYTLKVEFNELAQDDHSNSCSNATNVNVGGNLNGNIESGGDYDYFRINVSSSGKLRVYTTGSTDTYGYLKNSNCNTIISNDDWGGTRNFNIERDVTAGTYYVAVRHYDS